MKTNEEQIEVLNGLIEINNDRVNGKIITDQQSKLNASHFIIKKFRDSEQEIKA